MRTAPAPKAPANDTLNQTRRHATRAGDDRRLTPRRDADRGRLPDHLRRRRALIAQLTEQQPFRRLERQQRIVDAEHTLARTELCAAAWYVLVTVVVDAFGVI
jgi:hypothetical protein